MEPGVILEWVIKSVVILISMTAGFAYTTWYERKVLAKMQVRIGPNRAGPFALLQPVADGIKLIFKEELVPAEADKLIFNLAPVITVIPALIVTAVVPWGGVLDINGFKLSLALTDTNLAILYIMTVTSISVYGITLAGWSSNNKYAMLGGLRATAQMISYELALGLSLVGPVLVAGTMSLGKIVEMQQGGWFILFQPVAAIIYFIAIIAEVNRAPFDMPEAEQELTAGYHTEYSGMKFALFFMAEYAKMVAVSMIGATVFLGGYLGPFLDIAPWLGPVWLWVKVAVLLFVFIWIRATSPRIRYDRLMAFGWKILFPLALANVLVTAVVVAFMGGK
ncbi:MAG TPA: NADH-quinone oxidoreductase subunit NuoH [Anaerolineaceae bacterium]|mgnify:CR=1 FL=1|nr:NADH-quinone oxidoreductase subunit NuoH [Anaerolineaceae bacterium]HPN50681.1 NADH-quinone oxidoreductase subunit NuoH [Anaerolineaceae bacterium]